jgi:hypothetical protein
MSPTMTADEIRSAMQGIDWWHQIELGHEIVSPGRGGSTRRRLEQLQIPEDLPASPSWTSGPGTAPSPLSRRNGARRGSSPSTRSRSLGWSWRFAPADRGWNR